MDHIEYLRRTAGALELAGEPAVERHDWAWRAERTLADLETAPAATTLEYGDLYVMPYVRGQYPDSMVQLAIVTALRDYGAWRGEAVPLADALWKGVARFYDANVGTLRRYLPDVGEEKDYHAVDSWYLYHPMTSLARLALGGDARARELLLRSVDYGIRAARHFSYAWPVFYDIRDFRVITQAADDHRRGGTDCGGIYAYLMMQLHALTGEERYLDEARAALAAADGAGLKLMYQINLTAWGAAACLRVWKATGDAAFIERAHYWLANLFHYCDFRERNEGHARHYPTFMGAKCMYNSDYTAPLEDHECFTALGECLELGGAALAPAARHLCEAYRRHAAHRAWYYFPDVLPPEMIAAKQESGIIDRDLSFPLEDLYPDGRRAGQVGQEIYGAGAAFVFAAAQ